MKRTFKQVLRDAVGLLRSDIRSSKWAIIAIIAYFGCMRTFLHTTCAWVALTGLPCPGCGMTRAGLRLLHLDFTGAFRIHPFIYAVVFYLILFGVNRYILLRKCGWVLTGLLAGGMILMILFYIWRMLNFYPGEPPMSYYSENIIAKLRAWLL